MKKAGVLLQELRDGVHDAVLCGLYGEDLPRQRERFSRAVETFAALCGDVPAGVCSAPGRTEICGNHLDHQRGCVIAAAVNADMIAVFSPAQGQRVRLYSEGFAPVEIDISDTEIRAEEEGTPAALVRGIAAGFAERGIPVHGFSACVTGEVPAGSGMSSSAAFEVLVGNIFAELASADRAEDACGKADAEDGRRQDPFDPGARPAAIAEIGQFAENTYFGKPSGLMDQMACSLGGITWMDFGAGETKEADAAGKTGRRRGGNAHPVQVKRLEADLASAQLALCLVATGGSHADLTAAYASIPEEMRRVAAFFGAEVLSEVAPQRFWENLPELRERCGDRAVLRAAHYYAETDRVKRAAEALERGDVSALLRCVQASGDSSWKLLQNICPENRPEEQSLAVALMLSEKILAGRGACRVHGGGFAGTIQAFVPEELLDEFTEMMENVFGRGCCRILHIRRAGGCRVL